MDFRIEQMSVPEYARIQALQGRKTVQVGSTYWIEIRPRFYRPVLAYASLESQQVSPPCRGFGGYQYAVLDEEKANSAISFRVFDDCSSYSLASQGREFRRMVRSATKVFNVRPIRSSEELGEMGHKIYLSFYQRTHYGYMSGRIQRAVFDRWIHSLFACSKTIVLGAFAERELKSLTVCYWIDDLLLYSTSFSDSDSLKLHVSDVMLNAVREIAGAHPGVRKILAGMYGGGSGTDRFDLLRGGKIERRPARFVIQPALGAPVLKTFWPSQYRKLIGWHPGSLPTGTADVRKPTDGALAGLSIASSAPKVAQEHA